MSTNKVLSQATISARIDASDKLKFDEFCENVGMSTSALLNVFVKKVIREQRVPFSIESDAFYSESNKRFMRAGIEIDILSFLISLLTIRLFPLFY